MAPNVAGYTDDDGRIFLNEMYRKYNFDRASSNPEKIQEFVRAVRHEWAHRVLSPKPDVPSAKIKGWSALMRQLRWDLYYKNQFGRYLEEAGAEAYGRGSLREGLRYPLSASARKTYDLTTKGIAKDAGKLALGLGGSMGIALQQAHDTGQNVANFLDAIEDHSTERGTEPISTTQRPNVKGHPKHKPHRVGS